MPAPSTDVVRMTEETQMPELYTDEELDAIEAHIISQFGDFEHVFHEIVSPDIHVDICIIDPTSEFDHYTLVTMGMGAHRMNVPEELKDNNVDRAELLITLPPDWEVQNDDERWYWPIRCLKACARLPGEYDTWLGYGHTVSNEEPYADNTELCGLMLTFPYFFGRDAVICKMPDGSEVNFYQLIPLYKNEMDFKIENDAETLEDMFPEDFDMVVDIKRKNVLE